MAKYGIFDLGALKNFDKLWSPADINFLQSYIDNAAMLKVNYRFWAENFEIESQIRPTNSQGVVSFTIETKTHQPDGFADYKAPLAHNTPIEYEGLAGYSGSFSTFGKALPDITIEDRERMAKELAMFRKEDPFLDKWVDDIQRLQNHMDSLLSYNAATLLTTGKVVGRNAAGKAIMDYQDARIPSSNFVKGGTTAWTDASADLLVLMQKIETEYREKTGDEQPLKWQIPLAMCRNVFLTNAKLKEDVIAYRKNIELPYSSNGVVLEDWIVSYINVLGVVSPIEIVKEGEQRVDGDIRTDVKGWDNKYAVLRPRGYAGLILHGEILKASFASKYQSNSVQRNVAYLNNNLYALINSVIDIDGYPVLRTEIEGCAAPVLTCAPFITIVDTSQANA